MSELPEWVIGAERERLLKALCIAWWALGKIQNHGQQDCSKSVSNAEEALSKIASLDECADPQQGEEGK